MSSFFQETCKVLGIEGRAPLAITPLQMGHWKGGIRTSIRHFRYINAANTNWDTIVPFFLMAHREQPHSNTGYSPFYLLHGREMQLLSNDTLRARCVQGSTNLDQRIENLKARLRRVYKEVGKANRKAHQNSKRLHHRKAKARHFEANDLVYLYTPAMKPGLTKKFRKFWSGPYKVIRKLSELNYEIISKDNRKHIVHVNRIKRC